MEAANSNNSNESWHAAYGRLNPIAKERTGRLQEELARALSGTVEPEAKPRVLAGILVDRACDVLAGAVLDEEIAEEMLRAAPVLSNGQARRIADALAEKVEESLTELYCELASDLMIAGGLDEDTIGLRERAATAALLPPLTACLPAPPPKQKRKRKG